MQRVIKCDKCQQKFIQKWVSPRRSWSQINEVAYWTNGKDWNNFHYLCRSCLKAWIEYDRESFDELVEIKKQRMFFSYKGHGSFDIPDKPILNK